MDNIMPNSKRSCNCQACCIRGEDGFRIEIKMPLLSHISHVEMIFLDIYQRLLDHDED